jgi:predicted permease
MLMFILLDSSMLLFSLIQETNTDFNDLGKLMLAGFVAAIVVALGFTFVRFKLREKSPQTSDFISINSTEEKQGESGH